MFLLILFPFSFSDVAAHPAPEGDRLGGPRGVVAALRSKKRKRAVPEVGVNSTPKPGTSPPDSAAGSVDATPCELLFPFWFADWLYFVYLRG